MEYKKLSNGTKIPVIGLGTWGMGGWAEADFSEDEKFVSAIKKALDLGYTHIDTAELYGAGHTEEIIGTAIKSYNRRELFITSKVKPGNLQYESIIESAKKSLGRLGIDYLDLYLIHFPNPNIPVAESMKAMDYLVEKKLVRSIGVSNFTASQVAEAQKFAKNEIVTNQIEYNLFIRNKGKYTENMEREIIPYCQKNSILITAWKPLARGEFANLKNTLLEDIAQKYGKTQAEVAINWLISKPGIITIPKATSFGHLKENLGALGWKMEAEDIYKLDSMPGLDELITY